MLEKSESTERKFSIDAIAMSYGRTIIIIRWIGAWVDLAICTCFLVLPDWLLGNDLYQKSIYVWLALPVLYFVVGEWRFGRTMGKLLTRTIVVNEKGQRPTIWQAIVRTTLRLFEVNPFLTGGIPAGIVAALSSKRQRIGDLIVNTYVIRTKDLP